MQVFTESGALFLPELIASHHRWFFIGLHCDNGTADILL